MIALTGATGNIGGKIAEILLSMNLKIRCLARGAEKLEALAAGGAEVLALDLRGTPALIRALSGIRVIFTMIPPNYGATDFRAYQNEMGESIATAVEKAGVKYVVNLSSQGGYLPDGTGPIKGLHDQEERLNRLEGVHILHLRPTYFMENLLSFADMIQSSNLTGSAIDGDLKIPMIATRDIAAYAAERLVNKDFTGITVKDLLGQRDLSMNEATRIIGQKIGSPDLKYTRFTYEETRKSMVGAMGLSPDLAELFVEMSRAINEGMFKTPRTAENTTETAFEDFADVFTHMLSDKAA